ncbi:hypothetical protein H696_05014 [Fonticula alba]|uniref:BZIP domain-containing protein n=1 Tax=Fonticula alba TaxID=691883 RepID=A0A058Z475_FONAL|nr:hypothetical protein H696_05014 [Fonticula alba]KCV68728.1 hypothetical protein H696_05014 [Fonticula alba]|eukprot:XP_009497160.1 hypothetical protein H696_05014 [Fonticula alba]
MPPARKPKAEASASAEVDPSQPVDSAADPVAAPSSSGESAPDGDTPPPTRKSKVSAKRAEQNRAAQKLFRERRMKYVQSLEEEVKTLKEKLDHLNALELPSDVLAACPMAAAAAAAAASAPSSSAPPLLAPGARSMGDLLSAMANARADNAALRDALHILLTHARSQQAVIEAYKRQAQSLQLVIQAEQLLPPAIPMADTQTLLKALHLPQVEGLLSTRINDSHTIADLLNSDTSGQTSADDGRSFSPASGSSPKNAPSPEVLAHTHELSLSPPAVEESSRFPHPGSGLAPATHYLPPSGNGQIAHLPPAGDIVDNRYPEPVPPAGGYSEPLAPTVYSAPHSQLPLPSPQQHHHQQSQPPPLSVPSHSGSHSHHAQPSGPSGLAGGYSHAPSNSHFLGTPFSIPFNQHGLIPATSPSFDELTIATRANHTGPLAPSAVSFDLASVHQTSSSEYYDTGSSAPPSSSSHGGSSADDPGLQCVQELGDGAFGFQQSVKIECGPSQAAIAMTESSRLSRHAVVPSAAPYLPPHLLQPATTETPQIPDEVVSSCTSDESCPLIAGPAPGTLVAHAPPPADVSSPAHSYSDGSSPVTGPPPAQGPVHLLPSNEYHPSSTGEYHHPPAPEFHPGEPHPMPHAPDASQYHAVPSQQAPSQPPHGYPSAGPPPSEYPFPQMVPTQALAPTHAPSISSTCTVGSDGSLDTCSSASPSPPHQQHQQPATGAGSWQPPAASLQQHHAPVSRVIATAVERRPQALATPSSIIGSGRQSVKRDLTTASLYIPADQPLNWDVTTLQQIHQRSILQEHAELDVASVPAVAEAHLATTGAGDSRIGTPSRPGAPTTVPTTTTAALHIQSYTSHELPEYIHRKLTHRDENFRHDPDQSDLCELLQNTTCRDRDIGHCKQTKFFKRTTATVPPAAAATAATASAAGESGM